MGGEARPTGGGAATILFLNWRDCRNPEAGGSEIYVETVARALAAGGNDVTIHAAMYPGGAAEEHVDGVRVVRGGSKLSVYPTALHRLRRGDLGCPDVIVDVQNGIPFSSPLAGVAPTVVLVHHVHREQWPVVFGPVRSRIGWWVESKLAPRVYRRAPYVAVSEATRRELVGLGVEADRITVIHNGIQPRALVPGARSPAPRILVLGRLVPHKQVEHVLRSAARIRDHIQDLSVAVIGDGWWRDDVVEEAQRLGVEDIVEFLGFVDEETKQHELQRAWVLALPSLKEGWGLAISEAAAHGVPGVAYRSAGGVTESIRDGASGLLVEGGEEEFTAALDLLLADSPLRARLSAGALEQAGRFSWESTASAFAAVLSRTSGRHVPVGRISDESALQSKVSSGPMRA